MATSQTYLEGLVDQYYRQMQSARPSSSMVGPSVNPLARLRGITVPEAPKPSRLEGAIGPESRLGRVIDVLSRPVFSVGNQIKENITDPLRDIQQGTRESNILKAVDRGDNPINTLFNQTVGASLSGLGGRSKTLPSQAIFNGWEPDSTPEGVGRFAAGLATDIALDPLTYIPGGVYAGALRRLPGAEKAIQGLKKKGTLEKDAQALPPEIVQPAAKTADEVSPAPVAEQAPTPETFNLEKFTTALQKSVSDAANVKRTADGKKVYDFRRIETLYAKPKPAPKPVEKKPGSLSLSMWAQANKSHPVTYTDEGDLIFSAADDTEALSLEQVIALGRKPGNQGLLKRVVDMFEQQSKSPSPGSPTAPEAAVRAAGRQSGPTRAERIRGAEGRKRLEILKSKLDPEDYAYLISARSEATYKTRRAEILSRAHSPVEMSTLADAPENSAMRALLGQEVGPKELAPRQVLNPTSPTVQRAVAKATSEQFRPANMPYRSGRKDIARSNVKIGKGTGVSDGGFNKRAQYNLWRSLIGDASRSLKSLGDKAPAGTARGNILRQRVISELDEAEAVLRSRGIEPILGEAHSGIALSLGDVLHSLDLTDAGRGILLNNLFDIKKASVAPTALLDAVHTLFEGMKQAGIRDVSEVPDFLRTLRATAKEQDSLYSQIGRALVREPGGEFSKTADAIARRAAANVPEQGKGIAKRVTEKTWDKTAKHGTYNSKTVAVGGKELNDTANAVLRALTSPRVVADLAKRNIANSERYGAHLGYEVQRITAPVIDEFFATWLRPTTSVGEAIAAYRNVPRATDAAADSIQATSVARNAADEIITTEIADDLAEDLSALRNLQSSLDTQTVGSRVRLGQRVHDDFASEAIESLPAAKIVDVGENIGASLDHQIIRGAFPFTTKTPENLTGRVAKAADTGISKVTAQAGHATLRPALTSNRSVVRNLANYWRDQLTQVHKVFPEPEKLVPHMIRLQHGEDLVVANPAEAAALEKFSHLVKVLFEPSERAPAATGIFFRNLLDIDHINGKLTSLKFPEHMRFDIDSAEIMAKAQNKDVREVLANQWREWKIDDPIDFIARMQHAASSTIGDAAMAREASRIARSKGLMSEKRRDGFVQIMDSSGKSVMARYLPEGAWYHPDIVDEIKGMDDILRQSLTFDSPFGLWVNRYLDPFLNMWKAGMTIYRPGHHVRNLVGDSGLSFLADGLPKVHQPRNALKVMGMRNNYDDFSALRALQGMAPDAGRITEATLAAGNDIVAHATVRGKKVSFTAKEVHDYVRSHGMLPDFVSGEDLIQSADRSSESVRAIQESLSVFGGSVRRTAGRVSEARDDYVRLTHFLQILEKGYPKARNTEELLDYAVRRVRKWHPDGTDLAPFESKVMRRIMPFYSWTKKSLPLVVESMVMQPGRIMVWPKAMFNAAQASGINLAAISDPFPKDQMFPSFLSDEMTGPTAEINGKYYGINPGLPNVDLMNQFIGAPGESIAGMLSPFIKVPIEMRTETRLDTQSPITDETEYIGSNIPGVSHLNSLTGTDILGTIFQGQGIQPLRTVEKGNREQLDPITFANFLTGLGITDMSKPSLINYAEIEARNKAREESLRRGGS